MEFEVPIRYVRRSKRNLGAHVFTRIDARNSDLDHSDDTVCEDTRASQRSRYQRALTSRWVYSRTAHLTLPKIGKGKHLPQPFPWDGVLLVEEARFALRHGINMAHSSSGRDSPFA